MLSREDIESIRDIVRAELDRYQSLEEKRAASALRSRRYRERKRDASRSVTQHHTPPQENVTQNHASVTQRHASPGENGNSQIDLPLPSLPLSSPPHTPPLTLPNSPNPNHNNARARRRSPLMSNAVLRELSADPLYAGIDLVDQAFRFERWCKANKKLNTVQRFVNWINNPINFK